MHGKVHLSKGASTQHLTYAVERNVRNRRLAILREGLLDFFHNIANLLTSRAQFSELGIDLHSFFRSNDLSIEGLLVDV